MANTKQPNAHTHILIKGAKMHNLKNVSVNIPKNKLTVITGLSGSGKSTLAFDTLYAEGQRRYVESLSAYARQFLGRLDKPDVESIKGISPAIAIEQKVNTSNPRSTVGTSTEIYDFLKLLFARVGHTISPISGNEVKKETSTEVVNKTNQLTENKRIAIGFEIQLKNNRTLEEQLNIYHEQGFSRVMINGEFISINEVDFNTKETVYLIIDRLKVEHNSDENNARIAESAEIAFFESQGYCILFVFGDKIEEFHFSNKFELDGIQFTEPNLDFFTFNNPFGACPTCEGFGQVLGIDEDLVIPDKNLSIYEDAIACWKGEQMQKWKNELVFSADKFDFPIHKPFHNLTQQQKDLLWTGNRYFSGLNAFFKYVESKMYKIQYRVLLSRYRGKTKCPDCKGTRLRKDANYVKVGGKSITDIHLMTIDDALAFFNDLELSKHDETIATRLLVEIESRLTYLTQVGLGYLSLSRLSNSLSGGESQRINIATSLGSSLVGSMYILDEPSIGLHPRDSQQLIKVLHNLRDIGNTVIVVEHEEEIMRSADEIIDIGPLAGVNGGEIVFQGNHHDLLSANKSLTAAYLTGKEKIAIPDKRRKWRNYIKVEGARANNLKNIDVTLPLETITVVTGVSGSGKSSLLKHIVYPALKKQLGNLVSQTGEHNTISGDVKKIAEIEMIDQNPIGKSSRSNPVTYVKAYDEIRTLFSNQQLSKINGFQPKHFSFNVAGGRCDACEGEGQIKVSMQFMADVYLECEVCHGKRFKDDVLEVKYNDKNIHDVLSLTIDEALEFFGKSDNRLCKKIINKIQPLQDVGLGYVQLGQASNTLSGGEAQRIKLASFLAKGGNQKHTLFIFDEPTTGLHFHDIEKLLRALNALVDKGHSVFIIEHNAEIIKSADWVIDLGPEGGVNGGEIVFEGIPEDLIKEIKSYTGQFLKPHFK